MEKLRPGEEEGSALCLHGESDNTAMKTYLAVKCLLSPPTTSLHQHSLPGDRVSRSPGERGWVLALGSRLRALLGDPLLSQLPSRTLQSLVLVD